MMVNGYKGRKKAVAPNLNKAVGGMKAYGCKISPVEEGVCTTRMAIAMLAFGKMENEMAKEFFTTQKEAAMKVIGKKGNTTEKAASTAQTAM